MLITKDIEELGSYLYSNFHHLNIVGNSTKLLSSYYGSLIDKNTTIRFNYGAIFQPEHQGTKNEILIYTSKDILIFWLGKYKTIPFNKLLCIPTTENKSRIIKIFCKKNNVDSSFIDPNNFLQIKNSLGRKPSSGLSILSLLDAISFPRVSIFGFDWNKTSTYYRTDKYSVILGEKNKIKNKRKIAHNFNQEKDMCFELIEKNNWIYYE